MLMQIDNAHRATVLVEALPYIKKYNGKIVVVKYGGNAMINEELKHDVMRDMVLLNLIGVKVVLVHGGGPEISGMLKRVGKQSEFVDGLRVTDEETSEIVQMVLAGKINKSLVAKLNRSIHHCAHRCTIHIGTVPGFKSFDDRIASKLTCNITAADTTHTIADDAEQAVAIQLFNMIRVLILFANATLIS